MPGLLSTSHGRGTGAVGARVVGTNTAIPTSLGTTKFECNGLILNDRQALEHYLVRRISGLYDSEIRDNRELRSDRDGEIFYGALYSGKPIVVEGDIYATTYEKWLDMRMALAEAFDDITKETPFIGRTGNMERDWQISVVKNQPLEIIDEITSYEFRTPFLIGLRASKPYIVSFLERSFSRTLSAGNTFSLTNKGNRPASLRVRAWGRQRNFALANTYTGRTFRFKSGREIPAGRYYDIDFEAGTIIDDLGVNRFDAYSHSSDWPIELAKNSTHALTVTSDNRDSSAAVRLWWRDTYK